jgi:hypothetical protein
LIAGVCIPVAYLRLLPNWVIISGLIIAAVGELSYLDLITPKALPLIPLTRFPAFAWLIVAGLKLPRTITRTNTTTAVEDPIADAG